MTRAENWADSEQHPITADEWLALVAADPELRIDEANGPYFAVWSGPCSYPDGGWFDWCNGCVSTKHPDRAILGKLLRLAAKLGAVVQDDDGEVCSRPEDFQLEQSVVARPSRPWWRFW